MYETISFKDLLNFLIDKRFKRISLQINLKSNKKKKRQLNNNFSNELQTNGIAYHQKYLTLALLTDLKIFFIFTIKINKHEHFLLILFSDSKLKLLKFYVILMMNRKLSIS